VEVGGDACSLVDCYYCTDEKMWVSFWRSGESGIEI
jgi:hypothetical protein